MALDSESRQLPSVWCTYKSEREVKEADVACFFMPRYSLTLSAICQAQSNNLKITGKLKRCNKTREKRDIN
jgi:hypothetical protein